MLSDAALISEYCILLALAIAGLFWLGVWRRTRKEKHG